MDRETEASLAVGVTILTSGVLQPPLLGRNTRGSRFVSASDRRTRHCAISGSGDGPKYDRAAGGHEATLCTITGRKAARCVPRMGDAIYRKTSRGAEPRREVSARLLAARALFDI